MARAWPVSVMKAPQAAGTIHGDFENSSPPMWLVTKILCQLVVGPKPAKRTRSHRGKE